MVLLWVYNVLRASLLFGFVLATDTGCGWLVVNCLLV